ncbi:MAG: hypothetical protein PHH81_01545 [Bacteroides graminisolvens]|nr:hypothetical protein [Bacteroides graminisolvens]
MKRNILFCILFTFSIQFLSSQNGTSETIFLKNGSIIKGTIIEWIPNISLKIQSKEGNVFVYKINEIDKITKEIPNASNDKNGQNVIVIDKEKIIKENPVELQTTYNQSDFVFNNGKVEKVRKDKSNNSNSVPQINGYKGTIDVGITFGDLDRFELNSSHGYQFNPYTFIGGGIGVHYFYYYAPKPNPKELITPIFIDFRANFNQRKIMPFASMKLGYSLDISDSFSGAGVYWSPAIGLKFFNNHYITLYTTLSYSLQQWKNPKYYNEYDYMGESHISKAGYPKNIGGFSLKVGIEF